MAKVVILEAFYGGSHKQLLDTILKGTKAHTVHFPRVIFSYNIWISLHSIQM